MASPCRAKDPATCRTHGNGGMLQQLKLQAYQALDSGDTQQFFRIKEEIANIQDDEEVARRGNFFTRVRSRLSSATESKASSRITVSSELARKILRNYFSTSLYDDTLADKVTPVLSDASKSVKSESSDASVAAEEVYGMMWDHFSEKNGNKNTSIGGAASAKATVELFHRMNRTKELGWIESEAPGHLPNLQLEDVRAKSWVRAGQ